MRGPPCRKLLLFAISSLALLGSTGLAAAACPSRPRPPCTPVAFTGSVGAHVSRCVPSPPTCCGQRGARGRPGVIGKTGGVGKLGATGHIGSTGAAGPQGPGGTTGDVGAAGSNGAPGTAGSDGAPGTAGSDGAPGTDGTDGTDGAPGTNGTTGSDGAPGTAGADGPPGPTGPSGTAEYAEFFALMPGDNAATVAAGARVQFPQDGPKTSSIVRLTSSTFQLNNVATYRVSFVVSVTEAGQLELQLNGVALAYTVAGRATGASQIAGEALVTTPAANAVLGIMNPAGNTPALTITPLAGGAAPVSASLIIQKLG
jgi:hypothetical protein